MALIKKHQMLFLTLLFLFAFPVSKSLTPENVKELCENLVVADPTTDKAFCFFQIHFDTRTKTAKRTHDVLLNVIQRAKWHVEYAQNTGMKNLTEKYKLPIEKARIGQCEKDYTFAEIHFQKALEAVQKTNYDEAERLAKISLNAVNQCESIWGNRNPKEPSPLTDFNVDLKKFSQLIAVLSSDFIGY